MILLVNGNVWDITDIPLHDQRQWFRKWKGNHSEIFCYCMKQQTEHPPLHVKSKKLKDGTYTFFLSNNPKNKIPHTTTCSMNREYQKDLNKNGIEYKEGIMSCKLTFEKTKKAAIKGTEKINNDKAISSNRSKQTRPKSRLKTLFLALLQKEEVKVHIFTPGKPRTNISGRLEAAAYTTKVGNSFLREKIDNHYYKRMYVAAYKKNQKGKDYFFKLKNDVNEIDSPELIIGWGHKDITPAANVANKYKYDIPLYSVDEPERFVTNMQVYKPIFHEAQKRIENESKHNAVNTGYWVLYREENNLGVFYEDKELLFIPADPDTRIPIESSYELEMLKYLVSLNREFRKPLFGNEIENDLELRPDFVLLDTFPNTIIEVAGRSDEKYIENLIRKSEIYKAGNFPYIEWRPFEIQEISDIGLNSIDKR